MDLQRAKEIAASPVMAHVTHEGHQVYIQSVDEGTQTATVYHLKNPDHRYAVHVRDLTEQHVVH
ncbi:H-type small acid-soluble spore protein [Alicyclobacillus sendaiensis]|uniref:H-type small acid-soluble spore protein n=1 Tax=Alicyclobacillus sendaiensis PA2 TaxID=3029425 RepID=A0ABT6XZY5_ALISE|nr:H-type small acid-soluble spore protein [Alicyclobacillus sendaiensis]MDI9260648.1 H-type small acid-soluble spore protein [Alicyclobacillus sendaiensis PA2]